MTQSDVPQEPDWLRGSQSQLAEALIAWRRAGVEHLALRFIVGRWPDWKEQIARLAGLTDQPIRRGTHRAPAPRMPSASI